MLVVAGTITVGPEAHEDFLSAAAVVTAATVAEEGCLQYAFWADPARPGHFLVFEEWEAPAHLEAHLQTPHLKAFQAELAKMGLRQAAVRRYLVEAVRPL
jgi:quinol monooxygenase YgiN